MWCVGHSVAHPTAMIHDQKPISMPYNLSEFNVCFSMVVTVKMSKLSKRHFYFSDEMECCVFSIWHIRLIAELVITNGACITYVLYENEWSSFPSRNMIHCTRIIWSPYLVACVTWIRFRYIVCTIKFYGWIICSILNFQLNELQFIKQTHCTHNWHCGYG